MRQAVDRTGKRRVRAAGLMSGTSADGVDAVLIDFTNRRVETLAFRTFPYPAALRRAVLALSEGGACRVEDVCHYNFVLGEVFASALVSLAETSGIPLSSVDVVGSHGQTISHLPRGRRYGRRTVRSTLQIGEPSVIAERAGVTTVADFRARDVAAGGQGAPLVPYVDWLLLAHPRRSRAVQNIGGIANVTFLPAGARPQDVLAFDTGPGNMVIDAVTAALTRGRRHFDRDGRLAAAGRVDAPLLSRLLRHPYFRRRPPKTTGREEFGADFANKLIAEGNKRRLSDSDLVATATALSAETIAAAYRAFLPGEVDEVILCGGGARNRALTAMIARRLPSARVTTSDEFGIDADAKEAIVFAVLAALSVAGEPGNLPSATGASHPVVLGKVVPA